MSIPPARTHDGSTRGPLVIVGGRFERDNHAILNEIKRLSPGPVGVFATASEYADEVGAQVASDFREAGIDARVVSLPWVDRQRAAFAPEVVAEIVQLGGVYFTGGDQQRIIETLVQSHRDTPVLEALRALHHRGGLLAGSSAGAAIMSDPMILGGTSLEALTHGVVDNRRHRGLTLGPGLGFFGWGIIDQHFVRRGRFGRLLVALQASGRRYGFGIDENTALVVGSGSGRVVGESGVVIIDASRARLGTGLAEIEDVWLSYLDAGDGFELNEHAAIIDLSKKRARVSSSSYRTQAPDGRNAFSAYTLRDLMFRLVQGDPKHYHRQLVSAYDRLNRTDVTVELQRVARRSRALVSRNDGRPRFSAVHFKLGITREARQRSLTSPARLGAAPFAESRILLLGNSPVAWPTTINQSWLATLKTPIGVLASASGEPYAVGETYVAWLREHGLPAELVDLTWRNAERRCRSHGFLKRIGELGTLLFTGGDQRRLTNTLRRRGEATRALRAIQQAHVEGLTLVGVGGAAAAFGIRMIAEGSSRAALRHGSSGDAGHQGVIIEDGLGFFRAGLVDQHFSERHRLGRLIVACAEERFELGFGLSEGAGLDISPLQQSISAFGAGRMYLASVDLDAVQVAPDEFTARAVRLRLLEPDQVLDLGVEHAGGDAELAHHAESIDRLVSGLRRTCEPDPGRGATACDDEWLRLGLTNGPPARLDVYSRRSVAPG